MGISRYLYREIEGLKVPNFVIAKVACTPNSNMVLYMACNKILAVARDRGVVSYFFSAM